MTQHIQHPVNQLLARQWAAKQFPVAKMTEMEIRKKTPKIKIWSCNTQEHLDRFITVDKDMLALKDQIQLLQCEDDPVLITGETGTGKELIAHALHGSRQGKFIAVNCTALPNELIESELFGHIKGSFTGAIADRIGKFQQAWGGTIFLDEIGDMPLDMQTKLLRVLQEKVITPIGSNEEISIDCRVVAATNKPIDVLLNTLHFREDLFYRLAVFTLQTKSLRDRLCDIEEIVDSLGGEGLINAFQEWKKEIVNADLTMLFDNNSEAGIKHVEEVSTKFYSTFFNLTGNVRSLAAQVRRYQVLGLTK